VKYDDDRELRKAEELAIVEEVVSILRHDLRNRLATIRQAAFYLQKKTATTELYEKDPRVPRFFSIIEEQIVLAEEDLSKHEVGAKVYARKSDGTSSERVMRRALEGIEPEVLRSTTVEPAELCADEAEVALALRHLVDNAIEEDPGAVEVAGTNAGGVYAFRVSNRGSALDPARLGHYSQPFVSEKGRRGLGLAIARRVAERYGGGIRALSENSVTSVELFLPHAQAERA